MNTKHNLSRHFFSFTILILSIFLYNLTLATGSWCETLSFWVNCYFASIFRSGINFYYYLRIKSLFVYMKWTYLLFLCLIGVFKLPILAGVGMLFYVFFSPVVLYIGIFNIIFQVIFIQRYFCMKFYFK